MRVAVELLSYCCRCPCSCDYHFRVSTLIMTVLILQRVASLVLLVIVLAVLLPFIVLAFCYLHVYCVCNCYCIALNSCYVSRFVVVNYCYWTLCPVRCPSWCPIHVGLSLVLLLRVPFVLCHSCWYTTVKTIDIMVVCASVVAFVSS